MAGTDLAVGRLDRADVDAAHGLSTRAGWDTRRSDWRRMVDLDAVDAFAGRLDGRLVATATLVRYGSRVGWIGLMIVRRGHRRRGHGTRMLRACLEAADAAALDTVGLDANARGRPLYDAHGFVAVGTVTRWRGTVDAASRPERVTAVSDPGPVAALDRRACGVDRRFLLASLLDDEGTVGVLRRDPDGDVAGYALGLRRPPGRKVGPLVASTPDDAAALLRAVSARTDGGPVTVDAVGSPGAGTGGDVAGATADRYRRLGLAPERSLARMTHRDPAEPLMGDRVRGVVAFEYG
ncbi:MAG: GNAT family N-acetyltransferase [Haloferacaceae archaeon]